MRKNIAFLLCVLAVLTQSAGFTVARAVVPALPTFDQNSTGIYFDGDATSTIQVPANTNFDVGCHDFTIAWWQKAPTIQNLYPRLFQFGEGAANSDGFAVSEESGRLYFWFNNSSPRTGIPSLLNVALPDTPNQWNHFAIVRNSSQIEIYVNGVAETLSEAGTDGECLPGYTHTMGSPTGTGILPLLIGGSNDASLGGFKGEITGFEFFKGAKWNATFTPPTDFSIDSLQRRDIDNACTLESLLLLYPTEDFKTSASGLTNLITGTPLSDYTAVTYGQQGTTPTPTYDVQLKSAIAGQTNYGEGGHICLFGDDDGEVCNFTDDESVTILKDSSPDINIFPFSGREIESVAITPLGAPTVTSETLSTDIIVQDSNEVEFTFTRATGEDGNVVYVIPGGFSTFEILVTFRFIYYDTIELQEIARGNICLDNASLVEICSKNNQVEHVEIKTNYNKSIYFIPDLRYEFESVTITPYDWGNGVRGASVSSTSNSEDFAVTDQNGRSFIFVWDDEDLKIPEDMEGFLISVTFKRSPIPPLASPSIENTTAWHFNDYESYRILSIDENAPNDYSDVQSILLEVAYFPNDPLNPDAPSPKSFCRGYIDDWDTVNIFYDPPNDIATDGIEFWLPRTYNDFFENCPGYHQTGELTAARIYLFASQEVPAEDIENLNISTAMQFVSFNIFSSPGIESILTGSEVSVNEEVIFEASNIDDIRGFDIKFYSNIDFYYGNCQYYINIIDVDGNIIPSFLNEDGNITFNMPSYAEINSSCAGNNEYYYEYYQASMHSQKYFDDGVERINPTSDYRFDIQIYDKYGELNYWEGETATELILKATQLPIEDTVSDSDSNSSASTQLIPNPKPQPAPKPKQKIVCPTSTTLIVNFGGGSSEIKSNGNAQVIKIVKLIKMCNYNNIKLTGHASVYVPVTPSYKLFSEYLSFTRANAVKSAIAGKITTKKNDLNYLISDKSEQKAIKFQNSGKTRLSSRRVEVSLNY